MSTLASSRAMTTNSAGRRRRQQLHSLVVVFLSLFLFSSHHPANAQTAVQEDFAASVYCLANTPSLSWPSASLPDVQRVQVPLGTVLSLDVTSGSVVLTTPEPFATAVLRLSSTTTTMSFPQFVNDTTTTTTLLDCGRRATGMTAENSTVLEGQLANTTTTTTTTVVLFPLQVEVTIVLQNESPNDTAIQYAYGQVVLEEWMLTDADTGRRVGTSEQEEDDSTMIFRVTQSNTSFVAGEWQEAPLAIPAATTANNAPSSFSWRAMARLPLALVLWFFSLW